MAHGGNILTLRSGTRRMTTASPFAGTSPFGVVGARQRAFDTAFMNVRSGGNLPTFPGSATGRSGWDFHKYTPAPDFPQPSHIG